jgi:hypothetical protein
MVEAVMGRGGFQGIRWPQIHHQKQVSVYISNIYATFCFTKLVIKNPSNLLNGKDKLEFDGGFGLPRQLDNAHRRAEAGTLSSDYS